MRKLIFKKGNIESFENVQIEAFLKKKKLEIRREKIRKFEISKSREHLEMVKTERANFEFEKATFERDEFLHKKNPRVTAE